MGAKNCDFKIITVKTLCAIHVAHANSLYFNFTASKRTVLPLPPCVYKYYYQCMSCFHLYIFRSIENRRSRKMEEQIVWFRMFRVLVDFSMSRMLGCMHETSQCWCYTIAFIHKMAIRNVYVYLCLSVPSSMHIVSYEQSNKHTYKMVFHEIRLVNQTNASIRLGWLAVDDASNWWQIERLLDNESEVHNRLPWNVSWLLGLPYDSSMLNTLIAHFWLMVIWLCGALTDDCSELTLLQLQSYVKGTTFRKSPTFLHFSLFCNTIWIWYAEHVTMWLRGTCTFGLSLATQFRGS